MMFAGSPCPPRELPPRQGARAHQLPVPGRKERAAGPSLCSLVMVDNRACPELLRRAALPTRRGPGPAGLPVRPPPCAAPGQRGHSVTPARAAPRGAGCARPRSAPVRRRRRRDVPRQRRRRSAGGAPAQYQGARASPEKCCPRRCKGTRAHRPHGMGAVRGPRFRAQRRGCRGGRRGGVRPSGCSHAPVRCAARLPVGQQICSREDPGFAPRAAPILRRAGTALPGPLYYSPPSARAGRGGAGRARRRSVLVVRRRRRRDAPRHRGGDWRVAPARGLLDGPARPRIPRARRRTAAGSGPATLRRLRLLDSHGVWHVTGIELGAADVCNIKRCSQ